MISVQSIRNMISVEFSSMVYIPCTCVVRISVKRASNQIMVLAKMGETTVPNYKQK